MQDYDIFQRNSIIFTGLYSGKFETGHTKQVKGTSNVSTVQIVLLKITTPAWKSLRVHITPYPTQSQKTIHRPTGARKKTILQNVGSHTRLSYQLLSAFPRQDCTSFQQVMTNHIYKQLLLS